MTLLEANRPTVTDDSGERYLCYLRGRIKRDQGRILVGDRVEFEPTDAGQARITRVLPRTNTLVRPPIANIAGVFSVFSLVEPRGSLELLDKRLVMAHLAGAEVEVVITKVDLVLDALAWQVLAQGYRQAGYKVWTLSSVTGYGVESWIQSPRQGIWVLTGESGAGKSLLMKTLMPEEDIPVGSLSRVGRGQQTTRYVRLFRIADFWMADSPGYTSLAATIEDPYAILEAFREWREVRCRFPDCLHRDEPGCLVKEGVKSGRYMESRYQNYLMLLESWVKRY